MKSRIDISWVGGRKPWKAVVWVWRARRFDRDDYDWRRPNWLTLSEFSDEPNAFRGKTPEEAWHAAKYLIDDMQREEDCPQFRVATPGTITYTNGTPDKEPEDGEVDA